MNDIERQKQRETDAVSEGALRWCRSVEYQLATDTKPVRNLLGEALNALADAIHAEQQALKSSGAGRLPGYAVALLSLGHGELALITLGTLFNTISHVEFETCMSLGITYAASEIGQYCRIERIHDLLRERGVNVAAELSSRNRNRNAAKRAAELARKLDDDEDWAKNYRSFHLGEKLISLALEHARVDGQPIFELKKEQGLNGLKGMDRIGLTTAAEDWIGEQTPEALELFNPIYVPMIVPPRPWVSLSEGGYRVTPMKLLKRQTGKRAQKQLEKADLSAVFPAVNALQDTPYRMNKEIGRIMRTAWDTGLPVFGLEPDSEAAAEQEQEVEDVVNRERQSKGLRKVMTFRLAQAAGLLDEPRFYFPYQLDHRGRAYPVPQLMNPQSDHIGRSMIEFADGKPLGERGADWLAIHLANCYWKGSKVSFARRIAWVHENEKDIIDFAENPLRVHRFWTEADKQWMFLAAAMEWKGYREQGPGYCSHLAIAMDGSCNGYQHLSAMGRDPAGGRATNLQPGLQPGLESGLESGDDPRDIYQNVLDQANCRIERDAADPDCPDQDAARQLLGKLDRGDAKIPTMTTPFGVTRRTIYRQLLQRASVQSCRDPEKCADYLARVLIECIAKVAVAAGEIMEWLRGVARILGKKNRGMVWTTISGFLVIHECREPKAVRIATAERTILIYILDEKQKISVTKQVNGIVAHLVHSMDAAHMVLTVNRLKSEGVCHFAMVHDSFGVHAADIDLLNRVLREEFVRIYSEPMLQNFLDEQRKAHPNIVLPNPPQTGTLDIREVLLSPYFFA